MRVLFTHNDGRESAAEVVEISTVQKRRTVLIHSPAFVYSPCDRGVIGLSAYEVSRQLRPAPRACRVCGCTAITACASGCWWVEADLCSSCASAAKASE
ncbi:hypothetical protein C7S18_12335 [Ahniella affigens]|uniref:Uncharacterized protein n=1 Tax=Ahniella affigens TaxID=2021234 RepID=A0A2P1PSZ4_9GAMM|nr:hypothetical protein C7S18_12335 [Ahniella affigens]